MSSAFRKHFHAHGSMRIVRNIFTWNLCSAHVFPITQHNCHKKVSAGEENKSFLIISHRIAHPSDVIDDFRCGQANIVLVRHRTVPASSINLIAHTIIELPTASADCICKQFRANDKCGTFLRLCSGIVRSLNLDLSGRIFACERDKWTAKLCRHNMRLAEKTSPQIDDLRQRKKGFCQMIRLRCILSCDRTVATEIWIKIV